MFLIGVNDSSFTTRTVSDRVERDGCGASMEVAVALFFILFMFLAGLMIVVVQAVNNSKDKIEGNEPVTLLPDQAKAIEPLWSFVEENRLPRVAITFQKGILPQNPTDSRLGGPVVLPNEEQWPIGENRKAMLFLAQINFSELPNIPDFPTEGVLQIFLSNHPVFGVDLDAPDKSDIKVIWRPDWTGEGLEHSPQDLGRNFETTPMQRAVYENGLRMAFDGETELIRPPFNDWRFDEMEADLTGTLTEATLEEFFEELPDDNEGHAVGGHPYFVQTDFRSKSRYSDYDRVLLKLTSDRFVSFGDGGEAVFMISRADLLARNFSNVVFYWDCG